MQTNQSTLAAEDGFKRDHSLIIHPLDDLPEQKVSSDHLPPIEMTLSVRISLFALRAYLILMMVLLLYHVLDLAGLFHHHQ